VFVIVTMVFWMQKTMKWFLDCSFCNRQTSQ